MTTFGASSCRRFFVVSLKRMPEERIEVSEGSASIPARSAASSSGSAIASPATATRVTPSSMIARTARAGSNRAVGSTTTVPPRSRAFITVVSAVPCM